MKSTRNIFFKYLSAICAIAVFQLLSTDIADAAVVQRGRVAASRATASRKPVAQKTAEPEPEIEPETEPETETTPTVDISAIVEIAGDTTSEFGDASDDDARSKAMDREKKKRAATEQQKQTKIKSATIQSTANQCNETLRKCMAEKCGNNFTDCANDSTAQLDAKMTACRGKSKCSGTEYDLFSAEILTDIDTNRIIGTYENIMSCGIDYNNCIIKECATSPSKTTLGGCLSLADGNAAIEKCKFIADRCERYDNGLSGRVLSALSELRVDAEESIAADEARLYELRDEMIAHCERMGAAFDDRTFSCVYSIDFIAGSDSTIFASKKALAGSTFICEPDWFGIDITTFRENVYRHVRQQSSATSGMLGAGVGIAAGAVSSGAIGRAIETTKAKNATKAAEKEHKETHGKEPAETEFEATYTPNDDGTACESSGCTKEQEDALKAAHATSWKFDKETQKCIVRECETGYKVDKAKNECVPRDDLLSEEDSQARIDELRENEKAVAENAQTIENRVLGAFGTGATGMGGQMLASGIAQKTADEAAERDMTAYLATFRCKYGNESVDYNTGEIQLPGANDKTYASLLSEYKTLAASLKVLKNALGMAPGIESNEILDGSELYNNVGNGGADGTYLSLADALSGDADARAEWDEQKKKARDMAIGGGVLAGGAIIGTAIGSAKVNEDAPKNKADEINKKYDAKRGTIVDEEGSEPGPGGGDK